MAHKFERERMEPLDDGSVNIGIRIVPTVGQSDIVDPDGPQSCQWRRCTEAHVHGWDTCDIRALFRSRERRQNGVDGQGQPVMEDVPGTSAREQLVAWLQQARVRVQQPREIALPTRKVTREGKEVDEPIKDVSLT